MFLMFSSFKEKLKTSKYWNGIVPGYNHEIFKLLLYRCSGNTKTGKKIFSFLGPKIWSKLNASIKNAKKLISFMDPIKNVVLCSTFFFLLMTNEIHAYIGVVYYIKKFKCYHIFCGFSHESYTLVFVIILPFIAESS